MQAMGVNPDQETYVSYVFPCFKSVAAARTVLQVGRQLRSPACGRGHG